MERLRAFRKIAKPARPASSSAIAMTIVANRRRQRARAGAEPQGQKLEIIKQRCLQAAQVKYIWSTHRRWTALSGVERPGARSRSRTGLIALVRGRARCPRGPRVDQADRYARVESVPGLNPGQRWRAAHGKPCASENESAAREGIGAHGSARKRNPTATPKTGTRKVTVSAREGPIVAINRK